MRRLLQRVDDFVTRTEPALLRIGWVVAFVSILYVAGSVALR